MFNSERNEKYYDENIGTGELIEPELSNWYPVYEFVLNFLPSPNENPRLLDVGCGTGMFAKLLYKKGYTNYSGLDFSKERVKIARKIVPSFSFNKRNMFDKGLQEIYPLFDNIIVIEVLEHIENDLEFLTSIPEDKNIIISVPNYLSKNHVRAFPNKESVINRYKNLLTFLDVEVFTGKNIHTYRNTHGHRVRMYAKIFVFKCIKRKI